MIEYGIKKVMAMGFVACNRPIIIDKINPVKTKRGQGAPAGSACHLLI